MATRIKIRYVGRTDRPGVHERIEFVGGGFAGNQWRNSQQQVINWIEDGSFTYFVEEDGREIDVIVATSKSGHKYLKTANDCEHPEGLLGLQGLVRS